MKQWTKTILSFSISMMILCFLPILANAQCQDPDIANCPIDGGLTLLLAAGAGYGVKKIRDSSKKNNAMETK